MFGMFGWITKPSIAKMFNWVLFKDDWKKTAGMGRKIWSSR
jgi:hypothetical protein